MEPSKEFPRDETGERVEAVVRSRRVEELRREHEAFRRSARSLLEQLSACRRRESGSARRDCVREEFDAFARLLRRHFREEEASEVFTPSKQTSGSARRWIEATLAAHREFESRIDALDRRLTAEPPDPEIADDVRALVNDLFEHELSEERLVQRLVFEEPDGLDWIA